MRWQAELPDLISGLSYSLIVWSLVGVFRERWRTLVGPARWLFAAPLSLTGALQCAMFFALAAGFVGLAHELNLLSVACLLVVALSLRPFLTLIRTSNIGEMEAVLQSRLTYAEAQAAQSRDWLLMSEQIAHVGHWRIGFPAQNLFWSDEIYRIYGLDPERYTPEVESAIAAFHPDDRAKVRATRQRTVSHGDEYHFVARLIRPDGEMRYVLSRGVLQYSAGGEVIGLFGIFIDITEQKLIEEGLRFANFAAVKANEELHQLALMDSLSNLPNRRHFDVALEREFKRARREETPLALVMIDLDYFKAYNDFYGHPGGDDCLRRVAAVIATVPKRPGDQAARYGGEEFVMLLPGTDEAGAALIAERMVATVGALRLQHRGSPKGFVSVSCGVAIGRPMDDAATARDLVEQADQALYRAKREGRGRVSCHGDADLLALAAGGAGGAGIDAA